MYVLPAEIATNHLPKIYQNSHCFSQIAGSPVYHLRRRHSEDDETGLEGTCYHFSKVRVKR
jgi:hypothetical protein